MSLPRQGLLILGNPKYPLLSFSQSVAKDKQKANFCNKSCKNILYRHSYIRLNWVFDETHFKYSDMDSLKVKEWEKILENTN